MLVFVASTTCCASCGKASYSIR